MTSEVISLETMASVNSDTNPPTRSSTKNGVLDSSGQTLEGISHDASSVNSVEIQQPTTYLKVLAGFAAIGGFLFGYDTGVVSGALILLKQKFNLTTVWQELFVSITICAAAISAFLGGLLNDRFGRRPVILASSSVFLAGAVILALAINTEMLIIGRAVLGVGVGLASMTVPMYIAEASPPHARGTLVTINNLFITGGQFVATVVDGIFSYWPWGWRCMLGLAGVPALIQLIGFIFLPESPRWLILHGKVEKGKKVLLDIYGSSVYMREYEQISHSAEKESKAKRKGRQLTIVRMLKSPTVRRALILGCGLQMFQQLAGINTVMYYSASIIRMSGVQSDTVVIWLAAVVAFVNFSFTLVGVYCVEKYGRRILGLASMTGVAFSQIFLAVAFVLISQTSPDVISVYNGTNDNAACSSYHSCDSCIIHEECGFCYKSYTNKSIENSFCLQDSQTLQNESAFGPCSRSEIHTNGYTWAFDFCVSPVSFLALIGLILYLMFFAPGMGPLPWTVNAEIFPQWARSTGNAITSSVNWTCNIIVSMTFLTLTEVITRQGTFALYAVICFIGLLFMYLCLPETKGKPLEEVINLFSYPLFSIGRKWNRMHDYQNLSQEEDEDDDDDEDEDEDDEGDR